ncbi:MAG: NYN domain-containing protein [Candidatus Levybacteria bacterium]|nr:NYN domain-containing protein [Candidatus Levybacteria bacterium]
MTRTILFIDSENFIALIERVLDEENIDKKTVDLTHIDINMLIDVAFPDYKITQKIFYSAKLREHPDTLEHSRKLILRQRILKTYVEKQGFTFVFAGNVRGQKVKVDGKSKVIFREKGVDVRIAVDMVSLACDKKMDVAILCSSDSDLQPAVAEVKKRKVKVVYAGFEIMPNIGLTKTTNSSVLFRKSEIIAICPKRVNTR